MKTMVYGMTTKIHCAVHTTQAPTLREWEQYLASIAENLDQLVGAWAYAPNSSISGEQRSYADRFWAKQPKRIPIAVMTESLFVKAAANSLHWFLGGTIRAFKTNELKEVSTYLNLSAEHQRIVVAKLKELGKEINVAVQL
jgi:hypothetical protein